MSKVWELTKTIFAVSFAITSAAFTFIPESTFTKGIIDTDFSEDVVIIANRVILFAIIVALCTLVLCVYRKCRHSIKIEGPDNRIKVEYDDLFEMSTCNKVINFDECYTTTIGSAVHEIKEDSVCGQFLTKFKEIDFHSIVELSGLPKLRKHSSFNSQECYESGRVIPYNDYLLMAFAKLDKDGRGVLSREDYLQSLAVLWEEIDKHSRVKDVAIPVLGSGITRFKGELLTQQQLVDMIIASYKLSPYKLKLPATLHIVCLKKDDFSLNKVGDYI